MLLSVSMTTTQVVELFGLLGGCNAASFAGQPAGALVLEAIGSVAPQSGDRISVRITLGPPHPDAQAGAYPARDFGLIETAAAADGLILGG